jgi:phospholipase/lecithinase/hemolysin
MARILAPPYRTDIRGIHTMDQNERSTTFVTRWPLVACLALVVAVPGWGAAQSPYSGIVVFGTSLSDPGNAFALVGDASTPPDFQLNPLLIPSAPYAKGGHHFSNGATWIEQYARTVGLGDSVRPALATTDPGVTNYAVGAARAYNDGINFNLTRQVDAFLQRSGGVASSQALYVIEMGSNDIRDAFVVYAGGGDGGAILAAALGSIAANMQRLYLAGARNFLVWAPPNVALTPAIRTLGPSAGGLVTSLTTAFNGNLTGLLGQLSAGLPGISVTRLAADQILDAIIADPTQFQLTTVTAACLTPNVAPFTCQSADVFLFWDGIHPTKAGHAILAEQTSRVLP